MDARAVARLCNLIYIYTIENVGYEFILLDI